MASSHSESSSSTGSEDGDNNWDDWVEDQQPVATKSLFEDREFPSPEAATKHDKESHGFDLSELSARLALDTHQRLRLINYIRSQKPQPGDLSKLDGTEAFFGDDTYLKPVIEDDPLLQLPQDEWSSDEENTAPQIHHQASQPADLQHALLEIKRLQEHFSAVQQDLSDYRTMVNKNITNIAGGALGEVTVEEIRKEELPPPPKRDDDTHYFESYGDQAIHWTMISDKVRTSTYAAFIDSNPALFRDAIVMDVGCGTGVLSLFAARAGARHVIAVEASKIADKAEAIFQASGYKDKITLIRGKVETITLPEGIEKVDVIVSEWMGYSLLYESMLDSVLFARDKFLKARPPLPSIQSYNQTAGGVMTPSQCRMVLALCDPQALIKQRVGFWNDVYGFDMSVMAKEAFEDAIIECVPGEALLSPPCIVKDLDLQTITPKDLSFTAPFVLKANELPTSPSAKVQSGNPYFIGKLHAHRTYATAFVLWFDTFFHPAGEQYPPSFACKVHTGEGDWEPGDVLKLRPSGKRRKTLDRVAETNEAKTAVSEAPNATATDNSIAQPRSNTLPKPMEPTSPQEVLHTEPEQAGESREESFTTGPQGMSTHWKQAVFLLKTPIQIERGTEIRGTFYCRKSAPNSRELDVEFHFTTHNSSDSTEASAKVEPTIQCFRVQ